MKSCDASTNVSSHRQASHLRRQTLLLCRCTDARVWLLLRGVDKPSLGNALVCRERRESAVKVDPGVLAWERRGLLGPRLRVARRRNRRARRVLRKRLERRDAVELHLLALEDDFLLEVGRPEVADVAVATLELLAVGVGELVHHD